MKFLKRLLFFVSLFSLGFSPLFGTFTTTVEAANLITTKDTLSSSAISFAGRIKSPTVAGSAHVWIYTAGAACGNTSCYSVSTAGLKPGDSLTIGNNSYTVESIVDTDEFTLTSNLSGSDANDTQPIFLKRQPTHTITFTTASAIADGFFQVLLPAAASNFNDGLPDITGFDFATTSAATATDASGYTFTTPVATVSGATGCTSPANYHCFEFHYSGAGGNGTAIALTIGSGANTPIAPAPTSTHSVGTADTYSVIVKNFTSGANPNTAVPTDSTTGRIDVIESVRITATVDPTITFSIAGVASGATTCGVTTTIDTTTAPNYNVPVAVPFGTMALNTFKTAAHLLTVSTNAVSGYVITAVENDQMGKNGGTTPFIPDTACGATPCTHLAEQNWNVATNYPGLGFSLESVSGTTAAFAAGGSFAARQFASLADVETPQTIFSSGSVANSHTGYVCYRLSVDATQAAGDYENEIVYTATASF